MVQPVFNKRSRWRAQITKDGRRKSYTRNTQKECRFWLQQVRTDISNGLTFKGMDIRLDVFLTEWLESVLSSRKKSTYDHYRWVVQARIIPLLGMKSLDDLKPELVQNFYQLLLRKDSSEHQVRIVHKVLRVAMNHAVRLGYIARNPCSGTTPLKPRQKEMKFYNEIQVQRLLDAAAEIGDRFYPLYYLAVHTGMRQAELLGLKWEDVDWNLKTIKMDIQVTHRNGVGGGFTFTNPKSKSGIRKIILGEKAIEVLKKHEAEVDKLRSEAGNEWEEHNMIFPSRIGTPMHSCNLRRSFRTLMKASGLPKIRFHDLRHTAASLMLNHGIPVLIASKRLGHSKASITMDVYGHMMPNKQEEATELLDRLVNPD